MHSEKEVTPLFIERSRAFCMMPWVHFHVTQYGTVTPCCSAPWNEEESFGNINKNSIEEIWNGPAIQLFRQKMLRDEPDHRCTRCYQKDAAGLYSLRKATNLNYIHHLDRVNKTTAEGHVDSSPVYFDIRFSNFCNFRCRICGPWSSNSWFNDARKLGIGGQDMRLSVAIHDEPAFFEQLKSYLPQMEEIYFAGGEPMLMEQHYRLLDLLLQAGLTKTYLRYNTNFSVFEFKGKSILDYWKKFENIFLCASLDDNYRRGELQRKGQVWSEVIENRKMLKLECPHIQFMVAPTVNILNVFHLPHFHREWTEQGLIDVSEIFPSVLDEPRYYNIKALPADLKEKVKLLYQEHHDWMMQQSSKNEFTRNLVANEFLNVISFMLSEDMGSHLGEFKSISQQLDELRNEDLPNIVPELKEIGG